MKRSLLLVASLVIISFQSLAQSEKEKELIKSGFEEYLSFISESDWKGVGNKIYPGLFEIFSKQMLISAFKKMVDGGYYPFFKRLNSLELIEIENDIEDKLDNIYFGIYEADVEVRLGEKIEYTAEDIERFESGFSSLGNYTNIQFIEETRTISMSSKSHILAFKNEGYTFLEVTPSQLNVLKTILSDSIASQVSELLEQN